MLRPRPSRASRSDSVGPFWRTAWQPGPVFTALAVLLGGASLQVGCASDDLVSTSRPTPMTILVDPAEFLGGVPCGSAPGAMRSYVATVTDRSSGFVLASSPPTPCSAAVGFEFVIEGNEYSARIDGYEAFANELEPLGGSFSGSSTMLDAATGDVVEPRWRGACGEGQDGSATAVFATVSTVTGCEPLTDDAPSSSTGISIDISLLTTSVGCASDELPDGITSIEVLPDNPNLPPVTVDCGADPVIYDSGLSSGSVEQLRVLARKDETAVLGTTCFATVKAGLISPATCAALSDNGSIRFDPVGVLSQADATCDVDVVNLSLELAVDGGEPLVENALACNQTSVLGPIPAGDYGGTLTAFDADGAPVFTAACAAAAAPGIESPLLCTVLP